MSDRRLHVLVMPQQFPRRPGDLSGIFSLDYIASIKPHCDVTVLVPGSERRSGTTREHHADGVEYITWTPRFRGEGDIRQKLGRLESLYELGRLERLLSDVDLIHAHGPVFHGVPACTLAQKLGVPVVLSVHTGPFDKLLRRTMVRWLTRRTLERVDCVLPVSNDLKRQIDGAGIRPRRVHVTYNPVDTELFAPRVGAPTVHRRIVFAGRLEEYKGALRALRAFATLVRKWPEWAFAIVGDGPERVAIEYLLRSRPDLAGRVQLLGPQTKPQLAELFASSDCLVYPSRHETFGLVLAEAMSAGLPVIGPDRTAPPEFVDAAYGELVPPDDVSAIAAGIDRVLTNLPNYRRDEIRDAIVQRFGFEAFGRSLLALYDDFCQPRPAQAPLRCVASRA